MIYLFFFLIFISALYLMFSIYMIWNSQNKIIEYEKELMGIGNDFLKVYFNLNKKFYYYFPREKDILLNSKNIIIKSKELKSLNEKFENIEEIKFIFKYFFALSENYINVKENTELGRLKEEIIYLEEKYNFNKLYYNENIDIYNKFICNKFFKIFDFIWRFKKYKKI